MVTRKFDAFADQCNFGLTQITTPWVLSLDADYELTAELGEEIRSLRPNADVAGYRAPFIYRMFGRPLSATLYPPRTVLYRRDRARYRNEGHGHRVMIEGQVVSLRGAIYHDDRKPLSRWLGSQKSYARLEADYLVTTPRNELRCVDHIRLMAWHAPILVFLSALLWKRCILNGWGGWLYVLHHAGRGDNSNGADRSAAARRWQSLSGCRGHLVEGDAHTAHRSPPSFGIGHCPDAANDLNSRGSG